MTIAELIELLQQLPGDMKINVHTDCDYGFHDDLVSLTPQRMVVLDNELVLGRSFGTTIKDYLQLTELTEENANILKHFYGESTENESS